MATVATVCSASPGEGVPASAEWDAVPPGFPMADDVVRARRDEDRQALEILGAQKAGLGLVDELYRRPAPAFAAYEELVSSIGCLIDDLRPRTCLFPVGLGSGVSDHELTRDASLAALRSRTWCHPIAYADLPYALNYPWRLDERLPDLKARVRRFIGPLLQGTHKEDAVRRYATQLPKVPGWERAIEPGVESYFHVLLR